MSTICGSTGTSVELLLGTEPFQSWTQHAPIIGKRLFIGLQSGKQDLAIVKGRVSITRLKRIGHLQINYTLENPMSGFVVDEEEVNSAQPFDQLSLIDADDGYVFAVDSPKGISVESGLNDAQSSKVVGLFVGNIIERCLTMGARSELGF